MADEKEIRELMKGTIEMFEKQTAREIVAGDPNGTLTAILTIVLAQDEQISQLKEMVQNIEDGMQRLLNA